MRRVIFLMTGLIILILAGCSNYEYAVDCPDGLTDVSFQDDIQPIFNNKCISCHSGSRAPDLSDGWAYEELMNGFVDTDDPCASRLYEALSLPAHSDVGITEDDELTILGWIQEGAEDN